MSKGSFIIPGMESVGIHDTDVTRDSTRITPPCPGCLSGLAAPSPALTLAPAVVSDTCRPPAYPGRMRVPAPQLLLPLLTAALVLTGCSEDDPNANRAPGDEITAAEAEVLAEVLHRNVEEGGAEVTISAQYAEQALLTMTGSVDFTDGTGTLDTLTEYTDGQPDEVRTIYFTPERITIGNIPGLTEAMADAGREGVQYLRTDLNQQGRLVDNIVGMLTRLAADEPDDPNNLIAAGYTWQGSGRIDQVLTSTFASGDTTISVGVEDRLLRQFAAPPGDNTFPVRITLSNHGPQEIDFPPEDQIADASAYPEVAAQFGF